jgi:hypothetical protein
MNKLKPILTIVIILLLSVSFHTAQAQGTGQDKESRPWVFQYNFHQALYKTDMSLFGRDLSGLLFIKKTNSSYHMVLLSELGLKYLDIELFTDNKDISVYYCIDLLSHKKVINSFEKLFQMLFVIFPEIKTDNTFQSGDAGDMIRVIKTSEGKFSYHYFLQSGQVYEILEHKFLRKNTSIALPEYGVNSPAEMNFTDGKIKMKFQKVEK